MPNVMKKRVTALVVTSGIAVTSCTHSMRAPVSDPYLAAKSRRSAESGVDLEVADLSKRLRRGLRWESEIRGRQTGPTLENELPELADLQADVAKHPQDNTRRLKLAMLYHHLGLYERASTEYHTILDRDLKHAGAYERLGKLWLDWGTSDRALSALEKALALRPDFVEAYNTLGLVYDARQEFERSQKAYRNALVLNPSLDYVHNNLCFSYSRSGKFRQAVAACREALRLNPQSETAHNNLGYALGMLGDFAGAFQAFVAAGGEAAAHNNVGVVLQQKQRYGDAAAHFKKAWDLKPDYRAAAQNYAAVSAYLPTAPEPLAKGAPARTAPAAPSMAPGQASAGVSTAIPPMAEPLALSRQAEAKLLDALAEKLQLRVLSNQTESYSFNPDLLRLSTPSSGPTTRQTPAAIKPVLPPGALELRLVVPVAADASHGMSVVPAMNGERAPNTPKALALGTDFARLDITAAKAALPADPPARPILSPAAMELRPVAPLSTAAPTQNSTLSGSSSAAVARLMQRTPPAADFVRVPIPLLPRPMASIPARVPPAMPPAMELRPGVDRPESVQGYSMDDTRAPLATVLTPSRTVSVPAPARLHSVLPPNAMELRPVHTAAQTSHMSESSGRPVNDARLTPSESPSLKTGFARLPHRPEWRPAEPVAAVPPAIVMTANPSDDPSARLVRRVPEFPAQLVIQKNEPPMRPAGDSLPEGTDGSLSSTPLESYRFEQVTGGHLELPVASERGVAKYSMSGPLALGGFETKGEYRLEASAVADRARGRARSVGRRLWQTPRATEVATSEAIARLTPPLTSDATVAPMTATPPLVKTAPVNPAIALRSTSAWRQTTSGPSWGVGFLLGLVGFGGLSYHFMLRRRRRTQASVTERSRSS